ncbi:MAG: hypothetical protein PHH04_05670 [Thomasclavelia sp.]|jgi:hypothetical protein|nr:hypothetical protein [Thomasclavelia sp.]
MDTTFYKLDITISAKDKIDDSIIDPITFQLLEWGIDGNKVDWEVYKDKAVLHVEESKKDNDDFQMYAMTYQGLNQIMDLCYEYKFVMNETFGDEKNTITNIYTSDYKDVTFTTVNK